MLTEAFVAGTLAPAKTSNTTLTGIHVHDLQPIPALKSTFKRSSCKANCLAVSRTHIFAAQSDKAVVHVFSRERNNQEATVPFPERVTSIALAGHRDAAGVLAVGTESGRIVLWELGTGRQVSTPQHHLQAVTCLAVDVTSNYLISASPDSSIHVWMIPALLSFSNNVSRGLQKDLPYSPERSFTAHRAEITGLGFGHVGGTNDIAVSASKDKTCTIWDYRTGTILQTYLLRASPTCLALDPVDRALYIGHEDGSIQCINFYRSTSLENPLTNKSSRTTAIEAPEIDHWVPAPDCEDSGVLCLDVGFDGTMLISGSENGKVCTWDIARGKFAKHIMDCSAPVTNLIALNPTGFLNEPQPPVKLHNVVKPRYESFNQNGDVASASGIPLDYTYQAQFVSTTGSEDTAETASFRSLLASPCFPPSMLEAAAAELPSQRGAEDAANAGSTAVAEIQKEKAVLSSQLQSAIQELERRDKEELRRRRDENLKAEKKRKRRLQRIEADEIQRRREMGESVGDMDVTVEADEELSSSTNELSDSD